MPPSTPTRVEAARGRRFEVRHLRWYICALLFLGSTVNYIDRGTIAILAPHLGKLFNWSENDYGRIVAAFQAAYAVMMLVSGGVIDRLVTRPGHPLAVVWGAVATMRHHMDCR